MLQSSIEDDLARSLDRLGGVIREDRIEASVPALYYSAGLLMKYLSCSEKVNTKYFQEFNDMLEPLTQHDFTALSKAQQQIMDDVLETVNSPKFMETMRSEVSRRHSRVPVEDEKQGEYVLRAREHYRFSTASKMSTGVEQSGNLSETFLLNQHDQLWACVAKKYSDHEIDAAYVLANSYEKKVQVNSPVPPERLELIQTIRLEYETMKSFYDQFEQDGWVLDRQSKGIRLQSKIFEKEKQIAIRISGTFDIDIIPFLAIVSEVDLMGDYVPFCYDSKLMKKISRNERIGSSKVYIPLLTDRETYFYAAGYDRMVETGSVFLYSKTINEDKVYQHKYDFTVPAESDYVRLDYKFFIVEYKPLNAHRAYIRLASKVDMKLNFLPQFIINKSARIFAFDYFKNIVDRSKNFQGSKWEEKVKESPQIYDFFHSKVKKYLGQQ